jgi:excisionase family DNA binding protein
MNSPSISLRECAEALGVHYMTVYRYVRLGMLPASKVGGEWRVDPDDLAAFRAGPSTTGRGEAPWSDRLKARLIVGDEAGAWGVVEAALASGVEPRQVYLDVLGPAMRTIGEEWVEGTMTIADEHRASAVAARVIGRLGSRFRARGRPKGRILLGAPPGERHALPVAMVADLLRGAGFEVTDLGVDIPVESFVEAASAENGLTAVAVSVTTPDVLGAAAALISALRVATAAPVVVGGGAIRDEDHARSLGADAWAGDAQAAIDFVTGLVAA